MTLTQHRPPETPGSTVQKQRSFTSRFKAPSASSAEDIGELASSAEDVGEPLRQTRRPLLRPTATASPLCQGQGPWVIHFGVARNFPEVKDGVSQKPEVFHGHWE